MSLADLGRRAVACKHWRWMPGMLVGGWVIDGACPHQWANGNPWRQERNNIIILPDELPDLSDPATLGCLLHLVREAWGVERAVVWWNEHDQGWVADVRPRNFVFVRDSEAHALVAALEAAP